MHHGTRPNPLSGPRPGPRALLRRPARPGLVGLALVGVLAAGCAEEPAPGDVESPVASDDAAPEAAVRVLTREQLPGPVARSPHLKATVIEVRTTPLPPLPGAETGGLRVELQLLLENTYPPVQRGSGFVRRKVVVQRQGVALRADGVVLPPVAMVEGLVADLPERSDDTAFIPVSERGSRRALGALAFELSTDTLPTDLSLQLSTEDGVAEALLQGQLTDARGRRARAVEVLDPAGRPVREAVSVTFTAEDAGVPASRPEAHGPWRLVVPDAVNEAPGQLAVSAPGYGSVRREVPPGGLPVWTTLTLHPEGTDAESVLSAALGEVGRDLPPSDDLSLTALSLGTADAVIDFVRDGIAVLPTTGMRQGPGATLRQGAGSPVERAELARVLLSVLGIESRMACGDLSRDQVEALYGSVPPEAPLPETLSGLADEAREATRRLAEPMADALEAVGDPGVPRRTRTRLQPEWCWVQEQVDESLFVDHDLRPAPHDAEPLPFIWRTTTAVKPDVWRVQLRLTAVSRYDLPGGEERWEGTELLTYTTDLPSLQEQGYLVDLYPDDGELRVLGALVFDDDLGARLGPRVAPEHLDRVVLELGYGDPRRVGPSEHEVVLWERAEGGADPTFIRGVLSADGGDAQALRARRRVGIAHAADAHPAPGALALLATHDLLGAVRGHAAHPQVRAEPSLWLTTASEEADGGVWWSQAEIHPSPPAWRGDRSPTMVDRSQLALSDAAALAALHASDTPGAVSLDDLSAPTAWATDLDPFFDLFGGVSRRTQMALRRLLSSGSWVGRPADAPPDDERAWSYTTALGAPGLVPGVARPWPEATRVTVPGRSDAPATVADVQARWDDRIRCALAPRWSDWLGIDVPELPEACGAPVPTPGGDDTP